MLFENSGKKVVTEQIIITPDFMLNQFQKFISNEIEGFQSIKKEPNKGKGYSFVFEFTNHRDHFLALTNKTTKKLPILRKAPIKLS